MNKRIIIKFMLIILWVFLIFSMSSFKSEDSSKQSMGLTKILITYSIKLTNSIKITNIELNDVNINYIVGRMHYPIRKLAHFSEYFILAILVLLFLKEINIKEKRLFTIMFCMLVAVFDEIFQLSIDGRAGQLIDVIIDESGCLTYLILNYLYNIKNKCH